MKRLIVIASLIATPTFAQQPQQLQQPPQPPQSSPAEQALSDQMLDTLRSCVSVRAALVDTQRKLAEAQGKLKTLEAKPPDHK